MVTTFRFITVNGCFDPMSTGTTARDPERDDISLLDDAKSRMHQAPSVQTDFSESKKLSNTAMGCFAICILVFGAMTLIDLSSGVQV